MDSQHLIVKELQNGYRMDKPDYAPNLMGEIMSNCWKADPNERPTFSQIEAMICDLLESAISSYYLDLNCPYEQHNDDKVNAAPDDNFGLTKLLENKEKIAKSLSLAEPGGLKKLRHSMRRMSSLGNPGSVFF